MDKKDNRKMPAEYGRENCQDYTTPLMANPAKPIRKDCVFEIDEMEMDLYVVSKENTSVVIGKPVIYVATEMKSGIVIAVNAGIKNNSYSGFCDLLMTLLEPHSVQAKSVGAVCDDSVFPSLVMPTAIRCKRGSEYESKALEAACKELGIQLTFVKTTTNSMKKLSEACLHSIRQHFFSNERNANRTPLTLPDVIKILIEEACCYNQNPRADQIW